MENNNLDRFLKAQKSTYDIALNEILNGRKTTHWMWYIFPQLSGLGRSEMATYYGIKDLKEAKEYLKHPILGQRLLEISTALLKHTSKSANEIFGSPDDQKLHSSMTLFSSVENADPVFKEILNQFYNDHLDLSTIKRLDQ
ncbi:DUF1810 domain-containing protein [Agrobacterium tumefaciens]|nr:DUF1810 domain-containing protein [Agrobacterium tumefaciens]NTE24843.1 DUF1810 domain-containing protein [Agrobacterium tumefaciens]